MNALGYAAAAWVFLVALYGLVTSRDLVRVVLCLSVAQSSTYILLATIGFRAHATAPIFDSQASTSARTVDPVVQALMLTDVVVGATVTALLLAFVVQIHKHVPSDDPHDLRELRG